jgi:hypothetical protein
MHSNDEYIVRYSTRTYVIWKTSCCDSFILTQRDVSEA